MADQPEVHNWNDPQVVAQWTANPSPGNAARPQQLEMTLTLLAQVQPRGLRLLDLGCGDGAVAEMALTRLPECYVAGVDLSPPMLEAAERRLAPYAGRYRLYHRALTATAPLPGEAPFDAAVGVQSVHHLTGAEKRGLFRWVAGRLRPGGLLLLTDRVRLPSAALFPYYLALYSAQQAALGGPTPPAGYDYAAHLRELTLGGDRPDTVEDQLGWMREAGFGEAGCFYRHVERAIFGGLKAPPDPPDPDDRGGAPPGASPARRAL
jgi:tRNA (cmo5U34)-methyltransferase